jgi:hypothetical protein
VYTGFWQGNLRESDNLGDQGVDGRIILRPYNLVENTDVSEEILSPSSKNGGFTFQIF